MPDLEYYQSLPYTRQVRIVEEDGDEYFEATYKELPGCIAFSQDRLEAIAKLKAAFDAYIHAHLEWNDPIPEPARRIVRSPKAVEDWSNKEPVNVGGQTPLPTNRITKQPIPATSGT